MLSEIQIQNIVQQIVTGYQPEKNFLLFLSSLFSISSQDFAEGTIPWPANLERKSSSSFLCELFSSIFLENFIELFL